MHLFKSSELFFSLLLDLLGHFGFLDLLLVLVNLLSAFIYLAKLTLYCLKLLSQEVLPLGLVYLSLCLRLYLLLHKKELYLTVKYLTDPSESLHRVNYLKYLLCLLCLKPQVRCNKVSQSARVFKVFYYNHDVGKYGLSKRDGLVKLLLYIAHQGFGLYGHLNRFVVFYFLNHCLKVVLVCLNLLNLCLGNPLNQYLYSAIRKLKHAHNKANGSNPVEVFRGRVFNVKVLLGKKQDKTVGA